MSSNQTPFAPHLTRRALLRWGSALGGSATLGLLSACGGGGSTADSTGSTGTTGSGGTTASAYTSGAITGFGSIIVNGVRFDDSAATLLDDSGKSVAASALRLGAHVEIESGSIDRSNSVATALTIRVGSELVGPLSAIDTSAGTVTLLDQTVELPSTTVYDSSLSGGISALTVGLVVEIHAQLDTSRGVYVATRVEPEASATRYKLRGVVSALDTTAMTFQIGAAVINYSGLTTVPSKLADGAWIRVYLDTVQVSGQWIAVSAGSGDRHHGDDHSEAEVKGYITAWTSATDFSVDGLAVDASGASFPDGTSGVVLGAFVEVQGEISSGVLVATEVKLEDESSHGHGEDHELHGTISGLDTTAKTFVLRSLTVDYSSVTDWRDLTEADLVDGLSVEVKGDLSSDGTSLVASRISLDD